MNECISFVFSNNYNNYYKFLNKMSSSDDDMLVDPEGFYTRALADFDAYAKSIGLEREVVGQLRDVGVVWSTTLNSS